MFAIMKLRPALAQYEESVNGDEASVRVVLAWGEDIHEGTAVGSVAGSARPRLIGEATLRAVESISGGVLQLDLAAVATTDLGASRIAIAQVNSAAATGALVGSAVIHENSPEKATARAVLDAVNRHLELNI